MRPTVILKRLQDNLWCTCRVWLAFLVYTAIITGPVTLAQNPVSTLQETASEAKDVRSGRGHLFLILSVFFFVEGLGILAYPTLAQRVSHLCYLISLAPILLVLRIGYAQDIAPRASMSSADTICGSNVLCIGLAPTHSAAGSGQVQRSRQNPRPCMTAQ